MKMSIGQSLFFLGISFFLSACFPQEEGESHLRIANGKTPLAIGLIVPTTGAEAGSGRVAIQGAKLAVDRVNRKGGIRGHDVEIVVRDSQSNADLAKKALEDLIKEENVVAAVGTIASSRSMAMAEVAQAYQVPMIAPVSTSPKVTEMGEYVFRACFIDPFQGKVMAQFLVESLKVKNVSVLIEKGSPYSEGLAQNFRDRFKKLGGKVREYFYERDAQEYGLALGKIGKDASEMIYVPGMYLHAAAIVNQARKMGIKKPFAGSDGWDAEHMFKEAGEASEGSYFSTHYSPYSEEKHMREFVNLYEKEFGEIPDALAALTYDAVSMLLAAMGRVDEFKGPMIQKELARTEAFPGITGEITMDERRNPVKPAVIMKIESGQKKYVRMVLPNG